MMPVAPCCTCCPEGDTDRPTVASALMVYCTSSVRVLKVAVMLHASVTGPVIKVLPFRVPLQPDTDAIAKPASGVTLSVVVLPWRMVWLVGVTEPPLPAVAVTLYWFWLNVAVTAQAAVTGPVVKVLPLSVPLQPMTDAMV